MKKIAPVILILSLISGYALAQKAPSNVSSVLQQLKKFSAQDIRDDINNITKGKTSDLKTDQMFRTIELAARIGAQENVDTNYVREMIRVANLTIPRDPKYFSYTLMLPLIQSKKPLVEKAIESFSARDAEIIRLRIMAAENELLDQ